VNQEIPDVLAEFRKSRETRDQIATIHWIIEKAREFQNTSILQHTAFFMVQLSHPYMITGKSIATTIWTFDGIVISLLFNMLSRFVTAFLPRS